jgi:hypothetical protein
MYSLYIFVRKASETGAGGRNDGFMGKGWKNAKGSINDLLNMGNEERRAQLLLHQANSVAWHAWTDCR